MTQVYLAVMAVEGGRYVDLVGYLVDAALLLLV